MYYLCSEDKSVISCAVTVQLICESRFSHDMAHLILVVFVVLCDDDKHSTVDFDFNEWSLSPCHEFC